MVDPRAFQLIVIAKAIELYLKTGMKPNRRWTPGNMLATASKLTGKTYKRGQLQNAVDDLKDIIKEKLS